MLTKKVCAVVAAFAVIILLSAGAFAENEKLGYVKSASGDVSIRKAGSESWQKISVNTAIFNGDELRSTTGSAAVSFIDGSEIELQRNTNVEVAEEFAKGKSIRKISLKAGDIKANITSVSGKETQFVTPVAVCGVRGTRLSLSYNPATNSYSITCEDGSVYLLDPANATETIVEGGDSITVTYNAETGEFNVSVTGGEVTVVVEGNEVTMPSGSQVSFVGNTMTVIEGTVDVNGAPVNAGETQMLTAASATTLGDALSTTPAEKTGEASPSRP